MLTLANGEKIQLIDGHCHVASTRFIPIEFLEDVAANLFVKLRSYGQKISRAALSDIIKKQTQDHYADELVREMDGAGIDQTILLVPDFSQVMHMDMPVLEMASCHFDIKNRHPDRFKFFIGADPRNKNGVEIFEECIERYTADGLKLYPPCGYSPSDKSLYPYYEICNEYSLPVLLHTGPSAQRLNYNEAMPSKILSAARDFPDVNFILAHGGVSNVEECIEICKYRENVYMDIGGFTGAIHPEGWTVHLKNLFKSGVNEKIIFGTDWPIFKMQGGIEKVINIIRDSIVTDLPLQDVKAIFSNNINFLLQQSKHNRCNIVDHA